MTYAKGQRVVVKPTSEEVQKEYPVTNWLKEPTTVSLLEECPKGSVDVVGVQLAGGTRKSVYGFNIDRISS